MYKIAVVGDYDSIFGFAALGLDTFAVQTREEAAEKLHQLAQGGYGIIYITEKLAAELTHEIEKYQEQVTRRSFRSRVSPVIQAPELQV